MMFKDKDGKRVKEVVDGKKVTVYDEVQKEIKKDNPSRLHARRQMLKVLYPVTEVPAEAAGKKVGIHAHNNQQLAFANTIEALSQGVSLLDATMMGMGRGAGNCAMELLLSFLKNPKYNLFPVLKFIEEHMLPLQKSGAVWGYDIPYLLTGRLNQHPSAAIDYIKSGETNYSEFYTDLLDK